MVVEVDAPAYDGLQTLLDEEARIALAEGNYPRALRLFKRLLQIDPHDVRALREAGRIANATGDLEYAVDALERVDALDGTALDPELHYLRGESLYALGRHDEAFDAYARAERELGDGPHDRRGSLWLARIAVLRGDTDRAVEIYDRLLADRNETPEGYNEILLFKVEANILGKRWDDAERLLREFLEVEPDHARARALLAWTLEGGGKLDEELALRAEAVRAESDDPEKRLEYARALERGGDHSAALDQYREARSLGVVAASDGIRRLERRLAPEVGGGMAMRRDPSGTITGWRGGATIPILSNFRVAFTGANETSSGSVLAMPEREATTATAWGVMSTKRGSVLAVGTTLRLDELDGDAGGVGGSAVVSTRLHADADLQLRGDVNLPWYESASTLRDGGTQDTLSAQLYARPPVAPDRVVVSFGGQMRRLGLEPESEYSMLEQHAYQFFGAAGVDITLSADPDRVTRAEMYDREMLAPRAITTATVVSYRHYEMKSDDPFGQRLVLVERSSIDEVSGVLRRVLDRRGVVGAELRGGIGYDWVRYVTQWRTGASLLVSATPWSRFTLDYDVASESGTGLTGRQHIGSAVFHVDL